MSVVSVISVAIALADEWNPKHPDSPRQPSSFIAHAWVEQICAEFDASSSSWKEKDRRRADVARRLAGECADDIVTACIGQEPMYHRIRLNDKKVVCIGAMLAGCVPLWVHYYRTIAEIEHLIAEGS